jgi:predicted ATP-grasp superfamily ATP-dependent carboligase
VARTSPQTVLITLGRLPKALDLARSFSRLGYRVIVAEPFRWHLAGVRNAVTKRYQITAPSVDRQRFLDELITITKKENVELIVPISEEIMHVSFLRDHLPRGVRLYAMPPETLLALHNKAKFIEQCQAYGVSAPETFLLTDDRAVSLANEHDHIVKPVFSCSGRGVLFRKQGEGLPPHDADQPMIAQRWVKGNVLSTFSIAHEGRALTTVVYRGAVMSGTVAVCFERVTAEDSQHAAVTQWVDKFVAAANFNGFISFDLVVDEGGVAHGIECNPRATSGLHFVDPRDLATAVVNPEPDMAVRFRDELLLQQFYPCLTEVQKSMFSGADFRKNLATFLRARDVTWQWRDPLPFLTMPFTASQIIWLSIKSGTTFGEVATLDVGWYADPDASLSETA